ncbi:hypothetical protein R6Q57_021051 [Mikania cordata]
MISSKCRDLQRKVAKFNEVWIQHHKNRKSDENYETGMNEMMMNYARENGSFSHIAAWQVMKKSTKWHLVPKLQTSKRTKTSSSGKITLPLFELHTHEHPYSHQYYSSCGNNLNHNSFVEKLLQVRRNIGEEDDCCINCRISH